MRSAPCRWPARPGGKDPASAIPDEFIAELAFHLVNLAICINPARIAVGGMTRSWDRIRPGLDAALKAAVRFRPELVLPDFPFDAPLLGALTLAMDAALRGRADYHPEASAIDASRSISEGLQQ
jgi:glucokinase